MKRLVLALSLPLLAASVAHAAASQLGYSGRIQDQYGSPMDGEFAMTFRLHQSADDQDPLFEESYPKITTRAGEFSLRLNSKTKDATFDEIFADNDQLFLEIEIDGEVLSPRQELTAAAWVLGGSDGATASAMPLCDRPGAVLAWNGEAWGCTVVQGGVIAGPPGPKGEQGEQGVAGVPGERGPAGLVGAQGTTGAPGPVGATGPQGIQGIPGLPGADGSAGPSGANGSPGAAGPSGPQGSEGSQGPSGPAGPAGEDAIIGGILRGDDAVVFAIGNSQPVTIKDHGVYLNQAGLILDEIGEIRFGAVPQQPSAVRIASDGLWLEGNATIHFGTNANLGQFVKCPDVIVTVESETDSLDTYVDLSCSLPDGETKNMCEDSCMVALLSWTGVASSTSFMFFQDAKNHHKWWATVDPTPYGNNANNVVDLIAKTGNCKLTDDVKSENSSSKITLSNASVGTGCILVIRD